MKFKFLIETPAKDIVYIFHGGLSYMINNRPNGYVELFGYFDKNYIINQSWVNAQRCVKIISCGRILKTTMN